jgi:peptide/nickel transport system permease protein
VVLIVLCVNLLADAVRDALDPRLSSTQRRRPALMTRVVGRNEGASEVAAGTLLALKDVHVRFRGGDDPVEAVDGVSLTLARGERVGLAGASGSGKSVLAHTLLRLVPSPPGEIAGGSALFEGEEIFAGTLSRLQRLRGGEIGYVAQDPAGAFHPLIRVGPQVAAVLRRHKGVDGAVARREVEATLSRMRFDDPARIFDAYPHELSGGQLQRAAIARAIICQPALIIADEPTTALDMQTQAEVLDLLDTVQRDSGAALLFISHDLGLIARLCDRLMVMRQGRIVEAGNMQEVMERPQDPYTVELIAAIPRLEAAE